MRKNMSFESGVLAVLTLMLISVFVLSVHMYDYLVADTESGTLAVFADNVRDFLDENEAVAAVLGISDDTEEMQTDVDEMQADVDEEAAAYIAMYNGIYESFE